MLKVFTDGSCLHNPHGPGGWAFAVADTHHLTDNTIIRSGGAVVTDSNQMELMAILEALRWLKEADVQNCKIYTDSMYCIAIVTNRMFIWAKDNWQHVKSDEAFLVKEIYDLVTKTKPIFEHIPAHSGHAIHDFVDQMAVTRAHEFNGLGVIKYADVQVGDVLACRDKSSCFTKIYRVRAKFEAEKVVLIRPEYNKARKVRGVLLKDDKFNETNFLKITW